MKKGYYFGLAATGLLVTSIAAHAFTGQEYSKDAKISLKQARVAALKAHPGKITDQELEKEAGGSGLRYSFDIATNRGTQEVGVDAQTGSILENSAEGPHPD
ncbi:PepSY domain-containing protein [Paraburkholderia sp. IW21]|uniref:PepSY domain-containing protein n=1 Tax=Paraburkholderia sp. IW21 TaxID=3242488 RepID=UPI003522D62E